MNHPDIDDMAQFMQGYDETVKSAYNMIDYLNKNYNINPFMYEIILKLVRLNEEYKEK